METASAGVEWEDDLDEAARTPHLRFPHALEEAYRRDSFAGWLAANRSSFLLGLLILAGFGVVDPLAAPGSLGPVLVLRLIGCTAIGGVLLLSTRPIYRRMMQPASTIAIVVVGTVIVGMELVMRPALPGYHLYIFGVLPVIFFGYTAPRLRFWYSVSAGWAIGAVCVVAGIGHAMLHDAGSNVTFVISEALIVTANLVGMIAAYSIDTGLRRNYAQQRLVERERRRSEALLLNVLPAPIAERLKRGESVVDSLDEVTVLFADVVGFTPYSARLSPDRLVAFLSEAFSRFDQLAEGREVEKIKTIGDEYMAVAGIPEWRSDDPERIASLALDMREEIARIGRDAGTSLQLRIGLHTGPVVAGVIGLRKFSYDLWGDTVNTASRMESHAPPGEIQVTSAVYERLLGRFAFEGPCTVDVKSIGPMTTYLLKARLG